MAALRAAVFFDTSIFVAGLLEVGSAWEPAQRLVSLAAEQKGAPSQTAWHCCLEIYSVATRLPEDFRLSPDDAFRIVDESILPHFKVLELPAKRRRGFLRSAAGERVGGGRLYDAHIAEVARSAGAKVVLTENRRHFTSLLRYGVRVLTAPELAAEVGL